MSELTINDFRSVMGKFNLGSLQLEGEGDSQKIKLVNNHNQLRSFRNTTPSSPEANTAIRTQFANAIETYLKSRGYDTGAETSVGKFLDAVRQDLLGDDVKTQDLSRSADVARILDKLDAAVALGDFDLQPRGSVALKERFFLTAEMGQKTGGSFQLSGRSKADALASQTLVTVKEMLTLDDAGKLPNDKQLLKLAMKGAHISDTRASTYLMTRPETILVKADKYLREALAGMKPSEQNEVMHGVGKANLARLAIAKAVEDIHADTVSAKGLSELAGNRRRAANMMMGLDAFNVDVLADKGELNTLLASLSRLAAGTASSCKVSVLGQEMTLAKDGAGELTATLGKIRFAAFGDAQVMLRSIENAIVNGDLSAKDLKAVYQNADYLAAGGDKAESARRARTIGTAIIQQASDLGAVELQVLTDKNLGRVVDAILDGQLKTSEDVQERVNSLASTRMYSEATLETVNSYLKAAPEVQQTAVIAEVRTDETPAVNKLVADLFTNADVWVMDNTDDKVGGRLQETLLAHKDTLVALLNGTAKLDSLPVIEGVDVTGVVDKLLALLRENGVTDAASLETFVAANPDALGRFEAEIDGAADAAILTIQSTFGEKMSQNVGEVKVDNRELWEKSLDDVIADQKKSSGSVEGQFVNRLMKEYLKRSSAAEKRSMVASLVNLTTAASGDVQKFSAILKGAGPVFQKLLQGFPEDQVPASMRGVFADMKSHLAPIPDTVVKATFAKVVAGSNGAISSVTLDKTLGSASVGQAFLCTVKRADGTSQKAVVKMLKPDVQNRFAREIDLLRKIAGEVGDGMKETLEGRIATIKEELNFNVESENIKESQVYNGGKVKSVELFKGIASDMNVLVMTLAEGDTVDNYIAGTVDTAIAAIKKDLKYLPPLGLSSERYIAKDFGTLQKSRTTLLALAQDVAKKQAFLSELAKTWFDEAVFGKGFFQGDMHAGNILVSDKGVTVIDFGNAKKLSDAESLSMKKLICSAAAGEVDKFLDGMDELLKGTEGGTKLKNEATRAELKAYLAEIFSKGSLNETDARLFIAMNALQDRGIEIPSAVYNYTSSQNRLKNTIAEMGAKLDEVKSLLARTTFDVDVVYEPSEKGGGTRKDIHDMIQVRNFVPVVEAFSSIATNGFTPSSNQALVRCREKLAPENRAAVVEELMKPGQIDKVVKPAIALFKSVGTANADRGVRLADAEAKLAAATTDEARKAALTDLVNVLHEIQLQMADEAKQTVELPANTTLGEAISDVIESKVCNEKGEVSPLKALQLCSKIGGPMLAKKLNETLSIETQRPEREGLLDGYRLNNVIPGMKSWAENDEPIFKNYARGMAFSAATRARLADGKFCFGDDAEGRSALVKELARNVKSLYLNEIARGHTPLARKRGDVKLVKPDATFAFIEAYAQQNADTLQSGDLDLFGTCLAYVFTYLECIDSPRFFDNLAKELDDDDNGLTVSQLATELGNVFKLDDADLEQIVDQTFVREADLRGLDPKALTTEQKTALRAEIKQQVQRDFEVESQPIAFFVAGAIVKCTRTYVTQEDE